MDLNQARIDTYRTARRGEPTRRKGFGGGQPEIHSAAVLRSSLAG
jgi:hypothetical protein